MLAVDKPEISFFNLWPHIRRWHFIQALRHDDDSLPVVLKLLGDNLAHYPFNVFVLQCSDALLWWSNMALADVHFKFEVLSHEETMGALGREIIHDSL